MIILFQKVSVMEQTKLKIWIPQCNKSFGDHNVVVSIAHAHYYF